MRPKEKLEHYEEDKTEVLEEEPYPYTTAFAADIPESRVEIVPASQVTHLVSMKTDDTTAKIKVDMNYPLVNETRHTQENETPFAFKDNAKAFGKPTITELEPIQVTETEVSSSLDEYNVIKTRIESNATKGIVPIEGLVTSEVVTNIEASDFDKIDQPLEKAKPNVIPKDAIHISENVISDKEEALHDLAVKKLTAAVGFSTLSGINVLEVNDEMKEQDLNTISKEKTAKSKLNFTLLESVEVGEVFVEDKSGKYYPELIVPTETAKKEVLVSNQLITEIHNSQEKEGSLAALKIPQTQMANVDVTSKDSLVVKVEELHEKEGYLPISEMPSQICVDEDVTLHTSLHNTIVTSQLNEIDFTPESLSTKKATIGVTEHQHKFNIETSIHDSEIDLEECKSTATTQAEISLSLIDKPIIEEVQVNEREKELFIKDDYQSAVAETDIKAAQPIMTSQILEMTSTSELTNLDKITDESATETIITECAKVVLSPLVHDQEKTEDYSTRKPENVTASLVPNIPITVSQTESTELESKLNLDKVPDKVCAKLSQTHHLKTPLSEEITTADQYDCMKPLNKIEEKATEQRDLQKEVTILQTTVEEQLRKLDQDEILRSNATATFIGNEGINVTEVVSSVTEDTFETSATEQNVFAKMDIDSVHKIALTSEMNLGDVIQPLGVNIPKQEAASVTSSALVSLEISETKALDSQSYLSADVKPELKYLQPDVVSLAEVINVTEVMHHEKETGYEIKTSPETCTASEDMIGRPVAILSELIPDSSVGITKERNIAELSRKANVENIAHKEIIISTTTSNEKEKILDETEKPNMAAAVVSFDSNQAVLVEENISETYPEPVIQEKMVKVNAKESTINKEAIIQQETVANVSEIDLVIKENEYKTNPNVILTALQVPEYNEKFTIESENTLAVQTAPDQQKAESTTILKHGLQTTEILSQSENLEETKDIAIPFKKASSKIDDIYGKAAHIEELTVNQFAAEFKDEKPETQMPDVSPITTITVERTEVITAEKETLLLKDTPKKSNVEPQYSETQAVITSSVETVDKEQEFEGKISTPGQKISVGIVPFSSTINSEVLLTDNTEDFHETSRKTSVATKVPTELQKHLQKTEVYIGEKESILKEAKTDLQTASPKITEVAATEITEVNTVEKEQILTDTVEATKLVARPSVNEKQSILNTEVVATMESEILHVPEKTLTSALLTQGVQEGLQHSEPFIGESEKGFEVKKVTEKLPTTSLNEQKPLDITEIIVTESEQILDSDSTSKVETLKPDFEKSNYIQISETMPSEKEETFEENKKLPDVKTIKPIPNITPYSSIGIDESIINEKEKTFTIESEYKSQQAGLIVESQHHVTVIDNLITEKEDFFKPLITPSATNENQNQDITLSRHIVTTETVTSEDSTDIYEKISSTDKAKTSQIVTEALKNEQPHVLEQIQDFAPVDKQESSHANTNVVDFKSLMQVEVILQENSGLLNKDDKQKEKALPSQSFVKELVNEQPQVVETTSKLITNKYEPDSSQPSFGFETQKSYVVTESILQEMPQDFTSEHLKVNKVSEQVIEAKSIEQTEVVLSENVDKVKEEPLVEEKIVTAVPIENLALSQSSIMVHEKEEESLFEKLTTSEKAETSLNTNEGISVFEITQEDSQDNFITEQGKKMTAEKTITLQSHLQCTELIPETHATELITPEVQSRMSTTTSSSISPLVVTDNTILQKETDLHIQKTNKQTLRKGFTVANEIEVTNEFVNEQILPIPEKHRENISVGKITTSEDIEDVIISKQEVYAKGKSSYFI